MSLSSLPLDPFWSVPAAAIYADFALQVFNLVMQFLAQDALILVQLGQLNLQ